MPAHVTEVMERVEMWVRYSPQVIELNHNTGAVLWEKKGRTTKGSYTLKVTLDATPLKSRNQGSVRRAGINVPDAYSQNIGLISSHSKVNAVRVRKTFPLGTAFECPLRIVLGDSPKRALETTNLGTLFG